MRMTVSGKDGLQERQSPGKTVSRKDSLQGRWSPGKTVSREVSGVARGGSCSRRCPEGGAKILQKNFLIYILRNYTKSERIQ